MGDSEESEKRTSDSALHPGGRTSQGREHLSWPGGEGGFG